MKMMPVLCNASLRGKQQYFYNVPKYITSNIIFLAHSDSLRHFSGTICLLFWFVVSLFCRVRMSSGYCHRRTNIFVVTGTVPVSKGKRIGVIAEGRRYVRREACWRSSRWGFDFPLVSSPLIYRSLTLSKVESGCAVSPRCSHQPF